MFTDEQLTQLLAEAQEQVKASIIEEAKTTVSYRVGRELGEQINKVIAEYVKTEIVPEIRAYLIEHKAVILEGMVKAAGQMSDKIAEALLAELTDNLSTGYKRERIAKALFD